jgi:hypothetical protein
MAVIGTFLGSWYVSLILSVALSLASAAYSKHREPGSKRGLPDGQRIKANTQTTNEDMKVVYGEYRVGANRVYISTGGQFNFDAYFIHSIAVGENEGIVNDESGNPYIWFGGERIHSKYAGVNMWGTPLYAFEEKTGTATQTANSIITEHNDPLHYTHYVAWKLGYDQDKYRGIPQIQYLIRGRKLYDFRTGTTAWSNNPVLALYDYWTNDQYGMGKAVSTLELSSWEDAADYCETKGFKVNAVYFSKDNVWANANEIMDLFRGELTYWDGKYGLKFKDLNEETSVMTIGDEHICQSDEGKAIISISEPGAYDAPSGMRITYINAADNLYVEDSFIIGEDSGLLKDLNVAGCTGREMAGILGTYAFERSQLNRTISGQFRDDCLVLEPNDVITFNCTALNIADQAMRVVSSSYIGSGFINLSLQYENEDLYNDVYDINTETIYSTNLPDPSQPSEIENAVVTEDTYDFRLRTASKLKISFDIPENSWFKEVEVYVSTEGDVEANYKHQFNVKDDFSMDPVEEGQTYFIVLVVVNIWGAKQPFNSATKLSVFVTGKSSTVPESLTYLAAIAGNGSVSVRSSKLDDPDIEVYEFRMGNQWTGGIFLTSERSPETELGMVKPGFHDFWCNTKGTNDIYGDDPQDADVTVLAPAGWTDYTDFDDDFLSSTSGQSFTNVEHISYSGDDHLKCSHTAGVLDGQYISEEFDTGVVADIYYVFVETEIITVGAGTTWADILSGDPTWAELNLDTRKWKDVFEIEEAPAVTIRIMYKAETAHDWSYIEDAQILAGVITARYFKVEINIEDPAVNVNAYVKDYSLKLYSR